LREEIYNVQSERERKREREKRKRKRRRARRVFRTSRPHRTTFGFGSSSSALFCPSLFFVLSDEDCFFLEREKTLTQIDFRVSVQARFLPVFGENVTHTNREKKNEIYASSLLRRAGILRRRRLDATKRKKK